MKGVCHLALLQNLSYTKITIDVLGSNFNTHMHIYDHYTGVLSIFLYFLLMTVFISVNNGKSKCSIDNVLGQKKDAYL